MHQVVTRLFTILFSLLGSMVLSLNATAQNDISSLSTNNPEMSSNEDVNSDSKVDTNEILVKPSEEIHGQKEVKQPSKSDSKSESTKSENEEKPKYGTGTKESESVLSFNFLYYIIQKFKFTDVQEQ